MNGSVEVPEDRNPGRIFYGWVIVAIGFTIGLLTSGLHSYTRGIFLKPMADALETQVLLTAWVVNQDIAGVTEFAYLPLFQTAALPDSPIPQLGQMLLLIGVGLGGVMAIVKRSAVDAGLAGALASLCVACDSVASPHVFQIMLGAAGLIMTIAIVQDTYRMAFRDELTGLPSRRAFNERLLALGHRYSIAIVDVDHFKQVNDTYGHDLGDQVLKLVATMLERVGGGGRAYRYGGEEFTVVFGQ